MASVPALFCDPAGAVREHFYGLVESLSALRSLAELEVYHRPLQELLADALDALAQIEGFETSAIFLLRQRHLACRATRQWGRVGERQPDGGNGLAALPAPAGSPIARAAETREIQHCRDCSGSPQPAPGASGFPLPAAGSLLCAPIISRGEVLGVVVLRGSEPGFFGLSHEPALMLFCSVLGHVIDNHRLLHYMEGAVVERTAELFAANAQLKQEIAERERVERRLQQARDDALEAARVKGEFLANMSHELRTPLNGALGMLQLLGETTLDEDQHEYVGMALESGNALRDLIDDILDFSALEAGDLWFASRDFDLAAALREAAEPCARRARDAGLEFRCSIAADFPALVTGDSSRLRQVLSKLLGNAVKFTHQGWVGLTATAQRLSPERLQLCVEVADSGIGMSRDEIERAFQSFTQGDATPARKYGGSGLGLAITRQLVARMGGHISVRSEPGRGSVFRLTLPFAVPAADAPSDDIPALEPGTEAAVDERLLGRLQAVFGDDLKRVVKAYLRDAPEQLRALREAAERGDAETLQRVAGLCLGSAGNLGAARLSEMCQRLYAHGRDGRLEQARAQAAQIQGEFERVKAGLEGFLQRAPCTVV